MVSISLTGLWVLLFLRVASSQCSRLQSRLVRTYVKEEIHPLLPKSFSPDALPLSCQLNPRFDVYLNQEMHKIEISRNEWKCKYCQKSFKSEYYIDRHMDNKHKDLLHNESSICIGDLCPLFGCSISTKHSDETDEISFEDIITHCTKEELEKNKFRCEVLLRRCFSGLIGDDGIPVVDTLDSRICQRWQCEDGVLKDSRASDERTEPFSLGLFQLSAVIIVVCGALYYGITSDLFTYRTGHSKGAPALKKISLLQIARRTFPFKLQKDA